MWRHGSRLPHLREPIRNAARRQNCRPWFPCRADAGERPVPQRDSGHEKARAGGPGGLLRLGTDKGGIPPNLTLRVGEEQGKTSPPTVVTLGQGRVIRQGKSNHPPLKAFTPLNNGEHDMKAIPATVLGLALLGGAAPALAQPYGGRDYGYDRGDYGPRDRGYGDRGYGDRGYGDRDRRDYDRDYDRSSRGGRGDYAFNEEEYLRCNPDVRRAVIGRAIKSGLEHYRKVGMAEGRKLTCN